MNGIQTILTDKINKLKCDKNKSDRIATINIKYKIPL